nr:26S proteasome regulatory subunit 6A [Paratrimastix eleionoma]
MAEKKGTDEKVEEKKGETLASDTKTATPQDDPASEMEDFIATASTSELRQRVDAVRGETNYYKNESSRLTFDHKKMKQELQENLDKIQLNKQLPYLCAHIVEILQLPPSEMEADGANVDLDAQSLEKSVVIKASTRQTIFLPEPGLVESSELEPGDLVGVNKDSYLILEKLPSEYDSRVKAMEVDERPTESFTDVGGLDKQIEELIEAVVWPMEHKERFEKVGIRPPKGVLLYGPPGTGKTLLARAIAAQTKATFLKLAGPQLVQMYIGDGAKVVRDAFAMAKQKGPSIIFIDELDAIGTKRFDSDQKGDREVQRTLLELLNQLDGFTPNDSIKVIAATNRVELLDPALLRSGRIDRKIELPLPNLPARTNVLKIHSRKMNVSKDVNYDEIARMTDDFNGAMLKAVCVEAGMLALRRGGTELQHQDYVDGVAQVQSKKKSALNYYV